MKKTSLNPETIPPPEGNYSHAIEVKGNFRQLFISGQIPEKIEAEIPGDFESQCEIVWRNIGEILRSAGMDFEHLVKVTTYLTNRNQAERNGEIRRKFLRDLQPALTVVVVQTLDPKWLLEIEAIAVAEE
jgi:2-iminobutanoate/2-iminopropanoate deaminase